MRQILMMAAMVCIACQLEAQQEIAWFYKVTKTTHDQVYRVSWRAVVPAGLQVNSTGKIQKAIIRTESSEWVNAGKPTVAIVPVSEKIGNQVPTVVEFSQPFRWTSKKPIPIVFKGVFRYASGKAGSPMTDHEVTFQTGIL